jgi:hypothetical protein
MYSDYILTASTAIGVVSGYANVQVASLFLKNIDPILSPDKYESHIQIQAGRGYRMERSIITTEEGWVKPTNCIAAS